MTKKTRQAILVLGMHRSGTSALAGALGMLGMRLPARLLPTTPDNPKGYFEPDRIVAIHDRLLAAAGTNWSNIENLSAEWLATDEAAAFAHELATEVRQDYGDAPLFVVKDPRMCRLMPIWRKVLAEVDAQGRFAIPLRNPLEVARSLEKRDGLPLAHGCLLWLSHVLEAERETRGSRRVFIHYHDLLSDPVGVAGHVATQLAEEPLTLNERNQQAIASLIESDMRHHIVGAHELRHLHAFYPWLSECYEAHAVLVKRPNDKAPQQRLDELRAVFEPAAESFGPLLAARESALAERDAMLGERNENITALNQSLSERDRELDVARKALSERETRISALGEVLAEREPQIATLSHTLVDRNIEIGTLQNALAKRDTKIHLLGQILVKRDSRIAALTAQIEEIFHSTIWRLIAPVRWYGRLRQRVDGSARHRDITAKAATSEQPKPQSVDQQLAANEPPAPVHRPPSPYRCSLVIPTKNGGDLFKQVVDGLRTQTCWDNVEFIVVDSGSTDDTISVARSAGAIIRTVPSDEFNHGATRDYAISLSTNDYVVLMVQDAVPYDDFLIERLLSALSEEGVAGVYARQIPQPTADAITKRNLNTWHTGGLTRKVKTMVSLDWYERLSPIERYFFCNFDNVCSAINKQVWKAERFGRSNFGEDILWAERVLKLKFKIIYEPGAAVVHSHDRSLIYDYKRAYICNRLLYRQFGVGIAPTFFGFLRTWFDQSALDFSYVAQMEKRITHKLRLLPMIPAVNLVTTFGQYRAVKDEIRGNRMKVKGV